MAFYKVGDRPYWVFPKHPNNLKYAVVAVDYFVKRAKAESLAKITQEKIIHFIWKNIIFHFGIQQAIIKDNGKQFDVYEIDAFFAKWKITKLFSTPYQPQSNGQVEAVNMIIKHTLRTHLDDAKGLWAHRLPHPLVVSNNLFELDWQNIFCPCFRYRGSNMHRIHGTKSSDLADHYGR